MKAVSISFSLGQAGKVFCVCVCVCVCVVIYVTAEGLQFKYQIF